MYSNAAINPLWIAGAASAIKQFGLYSNLSWWTNKAFFIALNINSKSASVSVLQMLIEYAWKRFSESVVPHNNTGKPICIFNQSIN